MTKYEIIYDWDNSCEEEYGEYWSEQNIREEFTGTWDELQDYLKVMKKNGCYNIDTTALYDDDDVYSEVE